MVDAAVIGEYLRCVRRTGEDYQCRHDRSNCSVVILGEKHNNNIERSCQKKLIDVLKPDYVLVEVLFALSYNLENDHTGFRNSACVDNEDQKFCIQFKNGERENDFKDMSLEYNVKLIGCDLSYGELHSEFGTYNHGDRKTYAKREKKMGEVITNYLNLDNSSKPLVAIIGHCHAQKQSKIHEFLSQKKVDYFYVWNEDVVKTINDTPDTGSMFGMW